MTQPLRTFVRRGALFALSGFVAAIITISPFVARPAAAQITDFGLGGNSCAIETVGWVICPTMRSIARLADKGFSYINQSSMSIDYNLFDSNGKTYKTWEIMRSIANALFVVVFLYIIYTYLSGKVGDNYSIKRILPRLLVAVITVNLSFYIGVILIDIVNIIGDSLWNIMKQIYGNGSPVMPLGGSANPLSDGNLTKMTAAAMGNTAMVWVLMPLLAAVTIAVATVSALTVLLLIMREAVVAALILVAPVLIVLYLLPNTEKYAGQGMRLFLQLLLLYPIIAILLGTGQIVSMAAGGWSNQSAPYGGGTMSIVPDAVAAAAAVLPLLGIWFLFKNMSSIMSSAGARLSASVRGNRGDDKEARVTGKATAGAAAAKNPAGIGNGFGSRRQAFTRNRRHASLGGSALAGEEEGAAARAAGLTNKRNGNLDQNALDAASRAAGSTSDEETAKRIAEMQNAQINGEADGLNVDSAVAGAIAGTGGQEKENGKEKEKQKTAKDIFNNLNRSHESKDKDRKFASGPAPAGGNGQVSGGTPQPAAPGTSYRAPQMAQGANIVSGGSVPQQPTRIIAMPVQVDASALLGQNQHQPPDNVSQPPISGTEEKAKNRANKYLFKADQDVEKARDEIDILGRNHRDAPTEAPHTDTTEQKNDTKKDDES